MKTKTNICSNCGRKIKGNIILSCACLWTRDKEFCSRECLGDWHNSQRDKSPDVESKLILKSRKTPFRVTDNGNKTADISLCQNCHSMTKTIKGNREEQSSSSLEKPEVLPRCGKCKGSKI